MTRRIAGILTQSAGYPIDDLPVMAGALLRQVLDVAAREHVAPIGALEVQRNETWDTADVGFAWRLVLA